MTELILAIAECIVLHPNHPIFFVPVGGLSFFGHSTVSTIGFANASPSGTGSFEKPLGALVSESERDNFCWEGTFDPQELTMKY
ncbi:hypothetical protein, partial [Mesorhizobium sp. P5_C1]